MLGKVEICGVNTSRLKVLKNEEMMALMTRYRQGDRTAMGQMVEGNLRLVLSVLQRFDRSGENPDDLFQVGCIGLIKAIQNFNPELMVKFSTYGVPMISGEIRRFLRDNSPIRVSRSLRDTAYRVLQCRETMLRENQKDPSMEEIAEKLDLPPEELKIKDGDILAMVTNIKGLDIVHVGFAFWKDNHLHLLHASSSAKKVIEDPKTQYESSGKMKAHIGLRAIRVVY